MKALVREGASLRRLRGFPSAQFQLAYGDILVEHTVYRALAGCDRMYHVASNFRWWDARPERVLGPAVEGTRAVLEAARRRALTRVVVTSSVAALGNSNGEELMDERHEFNLECPELYASSKRRALDITLEMAEQGLPVVVVQPSAMAGPGDWKPTPVGQGIVRYLNAKYALPVLGGGVSLADVDDVVNGHIAAMQKGRLGESYILGGENITFRSFVERLGQVTHLAPPGRELSLGLLQAVGWSLETGARWFGGEPLLTYRMAKSHLGRFGWVTSDKAQRELGYRWRSATDTLRRAVQWYAHHGYVQEPRGRLLRHQLGVLEET